MLPVHAGSEPKQPNRKYGIMVVLLEAFLASTKFVQSLNFSFWKEQEKRQSVGSLRLPARGHFAQVRMKMKTFQTRDFPLAAFLMTLGFPLLGTESRGTSLLFCFPPAAADAAPGYLQGEKVPARAFYASIRDLKSLIHNRPHGAAKMNIKEKNEDSRRTTTL